MAQSFTFYLPVHTGDTSIAGGIITSDTSVALLTGVETGVLESPPHGDGALYQYNKYFVTIDTYDGFTEVTNVSAYFRSATHGEQLYLAGTPEFSDVLTSGDPLSYGARTGLNFEYSTGALSGTASPEPVFRQAMGGHNAVTLYNASGTLGGVVPVGGTTGDAVPFWLLRKIDEHSTQATGYFSLVIAAGGRNT